MAGPRDFLLTMNCGLERRGKVICLQARGVAMFFDVRGEKSQWSPLREIKNLKKKTPIY